MRYLIEIHQRYLWMTIIDGKMGQNILDEISILRIISSLQYKEKQIKQ
jgi:hypothetical protein